jgi:SAM-dependent methyltransferase
MPGIFTDFYSKTRKIVTHISKVRKSEANVGYCPICESKTVFIKTNEWLRDYYFCLKCRSIPRQRALITALNIFSPEWKNLKIHESSPGGPSSKYLKNNCCNYIPSQFFQNTELGNYINGIRCENLEKMTFEDCSLDLIITQDVFEHVMHPDAAFKEIRRVLKPGGAHIFTMPWYPNLNETVNRAKLNQGGIEFLEDPVYHGNPIDEKGSLVTFDWGLDFTDFIYKNSNMFTTIYLSKDKKIGLEGEFLEVFISRKSST